MILVVSLNIVQNMQNCMFIIFNLYWKSAFYVHNYESIHNGDLRFLYLCLFSMWPLKWVLSKPSITAQAKCHALLPHCQNASVPCQGCPGQIQLMCGTVCVTVMLDLVIRRMPTCLTIILIYNRGWELSFWTGWMR